MNSSFPRQSSNKPLHRSLGFASVPHHTPRHSDSPIPLGQQLSFRFEDSDLCAETDSNLTFVEVIEHASQCIQPSPHRHCPHQSSCCCYGKVMPGTFGRRYGNLRNNREEKTNKGMNFNVLAFVNQNSSLSEGKIQTRPLRRTSYFSAYGILCAENCKPIMLTQM